MQLEFFHDTICSFCFPMSYKLREISKLNPRFEIIHRSFALALERQDLINMFGNLNEAKSEILNHWEKANRTDPLHRFNIPGMLRADFEFPHSKPALLAAKAAGLIAGQEEYWDVFDALQHAMFVDSRNIADVEIIKDIVASVSINYTMWEQEFVAPETEILVQEDLMLAKKYRITGVPTLIVDKKYHINGSLSIQQITALLAEVENISRKEKSETYHDLAMSGIR